MEEKQTKNVIELAISADEASTTMRANYILMAELLKADGVVKQDTFNYLRNKAKELGYWRTDEDFDRAKRQNKKWCNSIYNATRWVESNMTKKWELTNSSKKKTTANTIATIDAQNAEMKRIAEMTDEEQEQFIADQKKRQELEQEIAFAQYVTKNAKVFKRLAEKEGIQTPADTIITTLTAGIKDGRIGK